MSYIYIYICMSLSLSLFLSRAGATDVFFAGPQRRAPDAARRGRRAATWRHGEGTYNII